MVSPLVCTVAHTTTEHRCSLERIASVVASVDQKFGMRDTHCWRWCRYLGKLTVLQWDRLWSQKACFRGCCTWLWCLRNAQSSYSPLTASQVLMDRWPMLELTLQVFLPWNLRLDSKTHLLRALLFHCGVAYHLWEIVHRLTNEQSPSWWARALSFHLSQVSLDSKTTLSVKTPSDYLPMSCFVSCCCSGS